MASAYDPASKTLFVPMNNLCMDYKTVAQEPLPGEDYGRGRMMFRHAPNNNGNIGRVDAVGVENKQTKWSQARHPYWSSSLVATAGGVVFGGDTNRRIVAFDGSSGKILWELPLNSQPGGSHDLCGWRQAICGYTGWPKPDRQSGRAPTDAGDSGAQPRLGAPGVRVAGLSAQQRRAARSAHVTNEMVRIEGDFEKGSADGAKESLRVISLTAARWHA